MITIDLVKYGDNYEIDIMPLRKVLDTLYKLETKTFNRSTKRWIIPVKDGEEFEKLFSGIAKVEIKDGREERRLSYYIKKTKKTKIYTFQLNHSLKFIKDLNPCSSSLKQ
jgi:hypothetical protein